jgi:3-phosphoshikimate 1-carboxyvinyltransferase
VEFDGDEQARLRPSHHCWMHCAVSAFDRRHRLPFRVIGSGSVVGGSIAIDASASSQFVSGLLLSGRPSPRA